MENSRGELCRNRRVLELSSVCIVDAHDKVLKEAKAASEPGALLSFLRRWLCDEAESRWRQDRCHNGCMRA
jgi:hypothetical protein